ncbi:MAG: PIG-L family deacetylase [Anaerolineae bacterium]|nr:PIG-L family deacetylase [Anaerolineae bacterium]
MPAEYVTMYLTWPKAYHIYLSPHLDDAILSCGGLIYQQARCGETVAVITIFAASPPPDHLLSSYAQSLYERWQTSALPGLDFSDPAAFRRGEDRRALAELDPAIKVIHCDLPDCIYRTDGATGEALYTSDEALFGAVHPADPVFSGLRDVPPLPKDATLYVPLAVGNHVDHQIVRSAAEGWGFPQPQMRYYEDYPYVTYPGALKAALGDLARWHVTAYSLSEEALTAKTHAVAKYASQISTFWAGEEAMIAALREHAQINNGEKLWRRPPH